MEREIIIRAIIKPSEGESIGTIESFDEEEMLIGAWDALDSVEFDLGGVALRGSADLEEVTFEISIRDVSFK